MMYWGARWPSGQPAGLTYREVGVQIPATVESSIEISAPFQL